MRYRTPLAALFACAVGAGLLAQQGQTRPGPPPQQPGRDTSAQLRRGVGTGSITGRVVALDTGRPLKRVRVSLSAAELPDGRTATTDEQGRFTFPNLPAGRYSLNASKPSFLSMSYGARRPGRAGRPLQLADGEQARSVDFVLPRGSVITGHVFDEDGEPMVGAQARVMRFQYVQGEKRLMPSGSATSDDRGEFRVYGLQPGAYYVAATSSQTGQVAIIRSADGTSITYQTDGVNLNPSQASPTGFAPTYYPGVTAVADALPINVGIQAEAGNIDFILQLVQTARVTGTVTGPDGSPAFGGSVTLSPDDGTNSARYLGSNYGAGIRPDGSFMVMNVPPGRYVAFARGQVDRGSRDQLVGFQNVSVAGADVSGVSIALTAGQSVSGAVTVEAGSSPVPNMTRVRVSLTSLSSLPIPTPAASGALLDGTFTLTPVVAGNYLVRAAGLPQNFALKAAYYGGRDVTDEPLEVRPGQNITGLSVVISDRVTELSGTVSAVNGEPATDYTVVAFSTDASNWRPMTRYIQVGRPDANGAYRIRGLPPGDYMVVALDDVESGEWYDMTFLDYARRVAVRVTLGDGDTKSLDLKLATLGR